MKLDLAYYGDPLLRKKAEEILTIDDDILQLIRDMEETMFATNGIGLAAPQVKRSLRLFIVNNPDKDDEGNLIPVPTRVFINPKILSVSNETWEEQEGCLSIPKIYEDVARPLTVKLEAQDETGKTFVEDFTGWDAKVILHENDHINGVLFIDRVNGKKRKALDPFLVAVKQRYYLGK